ncbi:MAG: HD domain-containing protein [Bacteroidales bacterium]|nr:HD domain-containing protein [Candidatus Cacconaster merdequi]
MISDALNHIIFRTVSDVAASKGVRAFVIGGYVRDYFLQRPNTDIDIVVEGSGIEIAKAAADVLRSKVSVFKNFGTAMFKYKGIEVEFVGARKESYRAESRKPIVEDGTLQEDQQRRDFTINAMAFSLQKDDYGTLVDPFGGIRDLNEGLIRTPLDPDTTYSDDPLRMLRAIRFATQLGFRIVPESKDSIRRNKHRMSILSAERIAVELNKILLSPTPSEGFRLLDECDLLSTVLPALNNLKGVETVSGKGHKDNFRHSLQVLDNVAQVSDNLWLRWAALLHDIGKAQTKRFEPGTGWTFHGHEYVGAKMVKGIFNRLKMSQSDDMKYVEKLVALHLRPIALVTDEVTDSAVRRLLFDAGDDIDDLMILCRADITSANEQKVERFKRQYEHVKEKLLEVEAKDAVRNFKNPITGDLIMEKYHIPPCQEIGIIKEYVKEAILDGVIPNEYEAAYALMEKKAAEIGFNG